MADNQVGVLPKDADAKTINSLKWVIYLKKHKGKTVEQIIAEDPGYIVFIHEKVAFLKVAPEILEKAKAAMNGPQTIQFKLDKAELEFHSDVLHKLSNGLDSYATNGVREVHGIDNDVNIHKTLDYFRRYAAYTVAVLKKRAEAEANAA